MREPFDGPYERRAVSTRVNSVRNNDPDILAPQTNERRLREDLATLKARGLAKSTGRGRGARWKRL